MYLRVNGVDMIPFLIEDGLEWSRNDIEAPDAGRTMDGKMWRGRVATKIKLKLKFLPLSTDDLHIVLTALQPEYLQVDYLDPLLGDRSVQMYSNNITSTMKTISYNKNTGKWGSFTAPLIER